MITKSFLSLIHHTKHNNPSSFLSLASNKYFKPDVKANQEDELKGQGRRPSPPQLKSLEDIVFPFPFEWTLQSNNFKYYDPRFT